jgi:hypothetical protein
MLVRGVPWPSFCPKGRKYLSAEALFRVGRSGFDPIADQRGGDATMALTDALMSAGAMFSRQSPSLLAYDTQRGEGHLHPIYGLARVPCDTSRREMLDPICPESRRPVCTRVFRQLQRGQPLELMVFRIGHSRLTLDGTGYFPPQTRRCASCCQKIHRHGAVTYSHQMLGAAIIRPDVRTVLLLRPAPIVQQAGTEKDDGERKPVKRFIARLRKDHPPLKLIVKEESLRSQAPHIETLQAPHLHDMLGVKEGTHAALAITANTMTDMASSITMVNTTERCC